MKKIILCLALVVSTHSLLGMDKLQEITISRYPSPDIYITRGDIYKRVSKNADITVIGELERRKLQDTVCSYCGCVGDISRVAHNVVMVKSKVFTKYFDSSLKHYHTGYGVDKNPLAIIVEGERFVIKNPELHMKLKQLDSIVLSVTEPELIYKKMGMKNYDPEVGYRNCLVYYYTANRRMDKNTIIQQEFYEDQAFEEAQKDLGVSYTNALEKAHEFFTEEHTEKSIAFSQLSKAFGFPAEKAAQAVVASVIKFITDSPNKDKYKRIEFFVQTSEEYDCYKNLVDESI